MLVRFLLLFLIASAAVHANCVDLLNNKVNLMEIKINKKKMWKYMANGTLIGAGGGYASQAIAKKQPVNNPYQAPRSSDYKTPYMPANNPLNNYQSAALGAGLGAGAGALTFFITKFVLKRRIKRLKAVRDFYINFNLSNTLFYGKYDVASLKEISEFLLPRKQRDDLDKLRDLMLAYQEENCSTDYFHPEISVHKIKKFIKLRLE